MFSNQVLFRWYLSKCFRKASLVEQAFWQKLQTTGGCEMWIASMWTPRFCLVLHTWRQSVHWNSLTPITLILDLINSSTSAHPGDKKDNCLFISMTSGFVYKQRIFGGTEFLAYFALVARGVHVLWLKVVLNSLLGCSFVWTHATAECSRFILINLDQVTYKSYFPSLSVIVFPVFVSSEGVPSPTKFGADFTGVSRRLDMRGFDVFEYVGLHFGLAAAVAALPLSADCLLHLWSDKVVHI